MEMLKATGRLISGYFKFDECKIELQVAISRQSRRVIGQALLIFPFFAIGVINIFYITAVVPFVMAQGIDFRDFDNTVLIKLKNETNHSYPNHCKANVGIRIRDRMRG